MKKLRLISKIMASPTGKQIILINILPNISRSKANHTTKFGQLIEYEGLVETTCSPFLFHLLLNVSQHEF